MKIVMLEANSVNHGDIDYSPYKAFGEVVEYSHTTPEQIVERIGDAEAVLINKSPMTAERIAACPNLRYIGVQATGYNVVDIKAAKERGIIVTNIPAYSTPSVAQHVFALLLAMTNRVAEHDMAVHAGRWVDSPDFCFWDMPLTELENKTLGVIGYGQIGKRVAQIGRAFGMKVIAYGPHRREDCMVPLDELLAASDVITLHSPLTAENTGMINKDTIAKMKDGVMIINTARGPLIDEQDLADALNSGKVSCAGLDVVSAEPMKADNPLLTAPNCIITPHLAWAPVESRQRLVDISIENVRAWIDGKPQNVVNP